MWWRCPAPPPGVKGTESRSEATLDPSIFSGTASAAPAAFRERKARTPRDTATTPKTEPTAASDIVVADGLSDDPTLSGEISAAAMLHAPQARGHFSKMFGRRRVRAILQSKLGLVWTLSVMSAQAGYKGSSTHEEVTQQAGMLPVI